MKLIIQIPCFNEAQTLAVTLADLPRQVPGFDRVEWLVIDDGSTDGTAQLARSLGVDHVVGHPTNRGLAQAFMTGLEACLARGADVIVNTDADNQYRGGDVVKLTTPIVEGMADLVVGARPIDQTAHFSWIKKKLQRLGSLVVRWASGTEVTDAPSGFRALSRHAAVRLDVFDRYTYTLETLIQAGRSGLRVRSVPIGTNADLRPSRLVKSTLHYVWRSILTITRVLAIYRPMAVFFGAGLAFFLIGMGASLRFLYLGVALGEGGHVQSVVLAGLCLTLALVLAVAGFLGELAATNRKLLQAIQTRLRQRDHANQIEIRDHGDMSR